MDFAERQKKVEDGVRKIMQSNVKSKENDLWLIIKYWQEVDGVKIFIPYAMVENQNMTSPESITRARRKIQAKGDLLPDDPAVLIRRKVRAQMVRNLLSDKPEELDKWERLYDNTKKGIRRVKYH